MFLKKCPFCNQTPQNFYNMETKMFSIYCKHCEEKGIVIRITDKDMIEAQKKWNERVFDNILLENPEQTITDLIAYKNGAVIGDNKYHFEYFDKEDFGWLIMDDMTVIRCNDSHPEELLKYYEIETDDIYGFDYETFCIENGIVRIGVLNRCFYISIPSKVSHEQITKTLEILTNETKPEIIKYIVETDSLDGLKNQRDIIEYNSLNELFLFLDKVA